MAINRIMARYTAATRVKGFIDKLGPTLAVHNAAIFIHVVFQLLLKDAVDPDRGVSAHIAAWELLWGKGSDDPGLIAALAGEERAVALRVLEDARTRATVLRALSHIVGMDLPTDVERELRDLVRHLVTSDDFDLDAEFAGRSGSQSEQTLGLLRSLDRITCFPSNADVANYVVASLGLEAPWRRMGGPQGASCRPIDGQGQAASIADIGGSSTRRRTRLPDDQTRAGTLRGSNERHRAKKGLLANHVRRPRRLRRILGRSSGTRLGQDRWRDYEVLKRVPRAESA
jgi:hypothetical protein